jgi:hypothetical protein
MMLASVTPRERALVRALRRIGRTRAAGAYREAGVAAEDGAASPGLGDWIARLVPEAASGAPAVRARAGAPPVPPPPASGPAAPPAMAIATGVLASVAVVFAMLRAWLPGGVGATVLWGMFLPGIAVLVAALQVRRANATAVSVLSAQRALALGDEAAAAALLADVARGSALLGATASLCLAESAERHGDFEECLRICGRALAQIEARAGASPATNEVAASLHAQSAVAHAAVGREAFARAELAKIEDACPGWGGAPAIRFRVGLLLAVHHGQLDDARRIASARPPDLVVPLRDELLAELVFGPTEELERELASSGTRSWIDAVAPMLRAYTPPTRVHVPVPPEELAEETAPAPPSRSRSRA